VSALSVQVAMT